MPWQPSEPAVKAKFSGQGKVFVELWQSFSSWRSQNSLILEEKEDVGIKDKNLPNTKNLDVKIDTDDVPNTEVDEITGKKVKGKEKKN